MDADHPAEAGRLFMEAFRGEYRKNGLDVPPPINNTVEAYISRKSLSEDGQSIDIDIDVERLRNLGIRAVFSYLEISNAADLGLASIGRFGHIQAYVMGGGN